MRAAMSASASELTAGGEVVANHRHRGLARVMAGVALLLLGVGLAFDLAAWDVPQVQGAFGPRGFPVVLGLPLVIVGLILATRRPGNPIGWLLLAGGVALGVQELATSYALWAVGGHGSGSVPARLAAIGDEWVWMGGFTTMSLALCLFPDGRPASPRWKPWIVACTVLAVTSMLAFALTTKPAFYTEVVNPLGVPGMIEVGYGTISGFFALLGMGVASLVVRFRRASAEERAQIRWMALVGGFIVVVFATYLVAYAVDPEQTGILPDLLELAILLGAAAVPVAIGVAVLKYRLYDIDVVISKTVVYGTLALFVTAIYVVVVIGVGTIAGSVGNPVLTGVATAVVALAFMPARRSAQHLANRLVYGKRATPYEVLSDFSGRMSQAYSLDDVGDRLVRLVAAGTGADRASLWFRHDAVFREEASTDTATGRTAPPGEGGEPVLPDGEHAVTVSHQGEVLGSISVVMPAGDPYNASHERLLTDVASQAGLVLRNVGLVTDLRDSRRRIVAAQDERARKLERDLHDGAQQQLVAMAMKQRAAVALLDKDPARAREMLEQIQADTLEALDTLRDLARGIYPPLLADQGLVAALRSQARKAAVPVTVEADEVGRYDPQVESAVYFSVLEALQNVAKYSGASSAVVRLQGTSGGGLDFVVADDGRGFDAASVPKGSGLQGMADRLAAVGGDVRVESAPGNGTAVHGTIAGSLIQTTDDSSVSD
jgi:signal transduction histidine kinase